MEIKPDAVCGLMVFFFSKTPHSINMTVTNDDAIHTTNATNSVSLS